MDLERERRRPILIAHRGASGERPEHSLAAYERAIDQGADYIEPDLVLSGDGVLVARHENALGDNTDVAAHPEFAARRTTRLIDGRTVTDWFTEDFTYAELATLRVRERLPQLRPASARFDGLFPIPRFDNILALVRAKEAETGRRIGIYPETKHPSYFEGLGLPHTPPLLRALADFGYGSREDALFIQSFEVGNLRALAGLCPFALVQLIASDGGPFDAPELSYAAMVTPAGLRAVAGYAAGIGPDKALLLPPDGEGRLGTPTALLRDAHAAGLAVHPWTFRRENRFLPAQARSGPDPAAPGDLASEIAAFMEAGVDGLFCDNPAEGRSAIDMIMASAQAPR